MVGEKGRVGVEEGVVNVLCMWLKNLGAENGTIKIKLKTRT